MKPLSIDTPVGRIVTERPARARVFERLGIDYCCGGKTPLGDACAARGLDAAAVLGELAACDTTGTEEDRTDWSQATLTALADHIETTHHAYLREALPRLTYLVDKVAGVHGEGHTELPRLQQVFHALRDELEAHMLKEEHVLFPMCRALENPEAQPMVPGFSIDYPIRAMEHEHDSAGRALAEMRALTGGFTPPADACNTYRAMLDGLAELEADLHRHIHKENNILFPRASAAAAARAGEKVGAVRSP